MTLSISPKERSQEPIRIAGTDQELWAFEDHTGSDYRLFCMIESHYKTCRVRTFATYGRAWIAALAADASGHAPALFTQVADSADPGSYTRTPLEIRLDLTKTEPTAYPGSIAAKKILDAKRVRRLLYEGAM